MQKFNLFHSTVLTLVLICSTTVGAKPRVSLSEKPSPPEEATKEQDLRALEDFGLTQVVGPDPARVRAEIYPFKQNIHLGAGVGSELSKWNRLNEPFLFVSYTLERRYTPRYELNLGILGRTVGFGGVRWKYEWNERNYFRPFAAVGLGLSFAENEGLATIVQIKNYGVPVGLGFEKSFARHFSYRGEIYSFLGFDQPFIALAMGLTSAW